MVFYANVFFTLFSFIPALFFWTWPTLEQTMWMVLIGVMATLGHLCMAQSLKMADATAVAPMDYTRMLFAAGVGFDVWRISGCHDMGRRHCDIYQHGLYNVSRGHVRRKQPLFQRHPHRRLGPK